MTYKPSNTQSVFVDPSPFLPDDSHQLRLKLTDTLRDYATGINNREISQYFLNELVTGSSLYSAIPQKTRQVFRKVINFGALPNSAAKSVPHGIPVSSTFEFIKMIAVGNDQTGLAAIAIPDRNSTLTLTSTDVVITTFVDYSAYTTCSVILEYVKV